MNSPVELMNSSVTGGACKALAGYWKSKGNRDRDGFLVVQGKSYPGFGRYHAVAAEPHRPEVQERFNAQITGVAQILQFCEHVPGFRDICEQVAHELKLKDDRGKTIFPLDGHIIDMSSPEMHFGWHNDAYDLSIKNRDMISVVVNLCEEESALVVWGFKPFRFSPVFGAACAFAGAATHSSCKHRSPEPAVLKVTLFYH